MTINENSMYAFIWFCFFCTISFVVFCVYDSNKRYDEKIDKIIRYEYILNFPDKQVKKTIDIEKLK